jgi:hypothetical protein
MKSVAEKFTALFKPTQRGGTRLLTLLLLLGGIR